MRAFLEGHAFFTGMAVSLLLLSILCRFITGVLLKKLIREAGNMSATENRLLKQCRLKFQNCYELNGGAVNVSVFVEKFMQNIRLGKCSLRLINQFSGQFLLLSVFADGLGSCLGIIHGETLGDVLPYYLLAFLSLYLHFSISGLIDVPGKQEVLRTTITDFLANRMTERIKSVRRDTDYLEAQEALAMRTFRKSDETEKSGGKNIRKEEVSKGGRAEDSLDKKSSGDVPDAIRQDSRDENVPDEELEALLKEFLA